MSSNCFSGIYGSWRIRQLAALACACLTVGVIVPARPALAQAGTDATLTEENQEIYLAQTLLGELGLYEGEVDGQLNAATREAIKVFQQEVGIEASGELDADTNMAFLEMLEESEELLLDEEGEFAVVDEEGGEVEFFGVECRGYNLTTDSLVLGSCVEGAFEGMDEETGTLVLGKCAPKGDLDGLDTETQERVFGTCKDGDDRVPQSGGEAGSARKPDSPESGTP